MRKFVLSILGAIIRGLPVWFCRRLLGLSGLLSRTAKVGLMQKRVRNVTQHRDQHRLLEEIVEKCGERVIYLEFGVWRGHSMEIAVASFAGHDADFYGFDSFEGLPKSWNRYFGNITEAGTFGTGGDVPDIDHKRVTFVKGWFENTVPAFLRARSEVGDPERDIVIYLDADLYHPTLFVLHRIASYRNQFYVLCDDWTGGVCEAIYDFALTSGFQMVLVGQVRSEVHGLPKKVSLLLSRTGYPVSPQTVSEAVV